MKKYTLDNAIKTILDYVITIDYNGWCLCKNDFDDAETDQEKKDLIFAIMASIFELDIETDSTQENLEDRAGSLEELHRHSYYSNEIFCEYFQCAFPYILKNDRTLLDADSDSDSDYKEIEDMESDDYTGR